MRSKSYLVLSTAVLLTGTACFQTPVASTGDISARVKRTATAEIQSQAKAISAVDSSSKEDIQLTMPDSSALAGTSVTVQPGTLSITTSLVIEQGVDFADSSLNSEITLSEDISIKQAGQGTIVRPSEDATLTKQLQLSLPLPVLGMRLTSVPYAIYYKYLDPITKQLMTGIKAVDGESVKISYDESRGGDVVQFGGYFGIYWVVVLNRPVTTAELPQAKVSSEPIINKNKAAVITSTGIVRESAVVAVQALPEVSWQKPTLEWDGTNRKVKVQATADAAVNACKGDFFESSSDLTGQTVDAESSSVAVYAVQKTTAHTLVGRLRCTDANNRSTLSPWSDALSIPALVTTTTPSTSPGTTPAVDTTAPTVSLVNSSQPDGFYGVGAAISIAVTFSEAVTLSGAGATLKLETGATDRDATYVSGSGSSVLLFQYTVQSGDTSADLDVQSANALSLLSGTTLKDAAGNDANLTINTVTALAANNAISIDTTAPAAPSSIAFGSSTSSNPFSVSFTLGTDTNLSTHNIKLCAANDCSTGCSNAGNFVTSPASVSGTNGTTVYACIKSIDAAGNDSAYAVSSGTTTIDTSGATVINVSSQTANGTYTTANAITLRVQFSEPVVVTNDSSITLLLETGTIDRSATYLSGSGTDTLSFRYIVSAGDNSSDLDFQSSSALGLGATGTIKDNAGNNADLTLPAPGSGNSIAGQSAIIIDSTPPTIAAFSAITTNASHPIDATTSGATTFLWEKVSGPSSVSFTSPTAEDTAVSASVDGDYVLRLTATDAAGNSATQNVAFRWDTTPPVFSGIFGMIKNSGGDSVWLFWKPATDTLSPSEEISYDICMGASPGDCASVFVQSYSVTPGVWNHQITGLSGSSNYEFIVRARDKAGNRDSNVVAKSSASLENVEKIAAGDTHSCALVNGGAVYCWGMNASGQLGDGTTTSRGKPTLVSAVSTAVAIAVSNNHSCAALTDGSVKCWGDNTTSQLGDGGTSQQNTPVTVTGLSGATDVALGSGYSCALVSGGAVQCWGDNSNSQLGNGSSGIETSPVSATGLSGATAIYAGLQHTCALLSGGTVSCWGDNSDGQIGNGSNTIAPTPTAISGLSGVSSMDIGGSTSCAVSGGNLYCWGYNGSGQFGNNSFSGSNTPTIISGLSSVAEVSVGQSSACIRVSGNVLCTGGNAGGELGIGNRSLQMLHTGLPGISTATNLSVGAMHTCAILSSGKMQCWGFEEQDQLGRNFLGLRGSPVTVSDLSAASVYRISDSFACSISSQSVLCRGKNSGGEVGDGTTTPTETLVPIGLNTVQSLATGRYHSCAMKSSGVIYCWGSNGNGQLGIGSTTDNPYPVAVSGISTATAIGVGDMFSCALLQSGEIKCWGSNTFGQLGEGTNAQQTTPVTVTGITNATSIAVGANHICARLSDSSAKCWGHNASGSVGDGTTSHRNLPTSPSGLTTNISSVWAGNGQSCAVLNDASAYCWGENSNGELGDGTPSDRLSPTLIVGLSNVSSIAFGTNHGCAVLQDGNAKCWGSNDYGQLGDGSFTQRSSPVSVNGLFGVTSASLSERASCFSMSDNKVRCIGQARYGLFGPALPESWLASMPVTAP